MSPFSLGCRGAHSSSRPVPRPTSAQNRQSSFTISLRKPLSLRQFWAFCPQGDVRSPHLWINRGLIVDKQVGRPSGWNREHLSTTPPTIFEMIGKPFIDLLKRLKTQPARSEAIRYRPAPSRAKSSCPRLREKAFYYSELAPLSLWITRRWPVGAPGPHRAPHKRLDLPRSVG